MPLSASVPLALDLDHPDLVAGLVWVDGVRVDSTLADSTLASRIAEAVRIRQELAADAEAVGAASDALPGHAKGGGAASAHASGGVGRPTPMGGAEARRQAIRDLLRRGGYKPTGRGKPASEYLAGVAARGEFPSVTNVVDAINLVSLESGLPISLIDLGRAAALASELGLTPDKATSESGDARSAPLPSLVIRFGQPDERYVFNSVGQEIDVEGLVGVALAGGPMIANPVKDRMATKVQTDTRQVLAVVYASRPNLGAGELDAVLADLARLFRDEAGAAEVATEARP